MLEPAKFDEVPSAAALLILQIIAGALIAGVVAFLGFAIFSGTGRVAPPEQEPAAMSSMTMMCLIMFAVSVPLSFIFPLVVARTMIGKIAAGTLDAKWRSSGSNDGSDTGQLWSVRQVTTIIGYALLEGPAFFACFAYSAERQVAPLAAAIVCIALMVIRFPTSGRSRAWIKRRLEDIDVLRGQSAGPSSF